MLNRRQVLATGLAVGVTMAVAPKVSAQAGKARVLKIGMSGYPVQIEPVMLNQTATRRVATQMFETLLAFDHANGMRLKPSLAESWKRVAPDAVQFNLRRGVRFHDGSTLTAADVAFSLSKDHLLGPDKAGQTVAMQTLAPIAGVDVIDNYTAVVRTSGPDLLLEQRLAGWSSEIVSKKAFDAAGSWAKWLDAPIGTGPYALVSKKLDVGVRLRAFPEYWGGVPPYAELEFKIIPELASRINALRAGDIDIATDLAPDQFQDVASDPALEVAGGPVQNIRYLAIDTTAPSLSDVRIRRAMSLAIDRKLLTESLWGGRLSVPNGWQLNTFGDGYLADRPALAYDPDAAKALLAEAKYAGEKITYRLLNNYYPNQISGAQVMLEMWRAVGLNVEIVMMENFSQVEKKPIQAIYDSSATAILADHLGLTWRVFGPKGTSTVAGLWSSNEYLELGKKLETATDMAARRNLLASMLDILDREMPCLILHVSGQFYGKRKDVNWTPGKTLDINFGPGWAA